MYERYDQPIIPVREFLRRVARSTLIAIALVFVPLLVGIVGYMVLAGLSPVDAFLNASMILGGMGPVDLLTNDAAKLFAGFYALFSGIFFLVIAGVVLAPFLHRMLHRLHVPGNDDSGDASDGDSGGQRSKEPTG